MKNRWWTSGAYRDFTLEAAKESAFGHLRIISPSAGFLCETWGCDGRLSREDGEMSLNHRDEQATHEIYWRAWFKRSPVKSARGPGPPTARSGKDIPCRPQPEIPDRAGGEENVLPAGGYL
jgi:hypothetical protein